MRAPHLLDVEVLGALRRLVAAGDASDERSEDAVDDLRDLPIGRYPHDMLVPRMRELRRNFSSYEATYLALAEALTDDGVPVLTPDAGFARATGHHAAIAAIMAA
jgi:predicted nucleic acid-binding protein